jgi:hypothetical protein
MIQKLKFYTYIKNDNQSFLWIILLGHVSFTKSQLHTRISSRQGSQILYGLKGHKLMQKQAHDLELVSKELNHLAAILHVYAGGLNFMK